jgi:hypothetical protein
MTAFEIHQIPTNPTYEPQPQNPPPERKIGDQPKPREVTAFRMVNELSMHSDREQASEPGEAGFKLPPGWDPLTETSSE